MRLVAILLLPHACTTQTIHTEINFDEPRYGAVCYRAKQGEQLRFAWRENHNFHELHDRTSYDNCDFTGATKLADAGPRPSGIVIEVTSSTELLLLLQDLHEQQSQGPHLRQQQPVRAHMQKMG